MGIGGHIRIHSKCNSRPTLQSCRASCKRFEFGCALHVEEQNVGFERGLDLGNRLAHPGKDNIRSSRVLRPQHSLQFSAGHYVESAAQLYKQTKNADVGIGFYRIADIAVSATKCILKIGNSFAYYPGGVHI